MTKKMLTMMAALLLSGSAIAAPVDATSAKQKAAAFLQKQAQRSNNSRRAAALRNPQLNEANAFGNALHVFNIGNDNGFVIVSGDDRTEEILGYVDGGNFDYNNMPENMRGWLQMYADRINSLGNSQALQAPRRSAYTNIEPLVETNWDQRNDYNDFLFFDAPEMLEEASADADDVYAGCAATSMAQALYQAAQQYKNKHGVWPTNPTTEIPSYTVTDSPGKINNNKEMKALEPIVIDWENMLPNYAREYVTPTDQQIEAVGKLMAYCGRAMHMEYGTTSSDAAFVYMPFRMAAYFGIQPNVKNLDRTYYTSQQWEDLLYNELSNGRAVPYTGVSGPTTSDPGHAFVLDGYKDGLWHINWGWGMAEVINKAHYNGYFSLSVMQPDKGGTAHVSGGALDSEYKYLQQATIGVSFDPVDDAAYTCYTHIGGGRGYASSTTKVTYLNYKVKGCDFTLDGAWAIDNGDGTFTILKKDYENREFTMFGDMATYTQYIDELPVTGIDDGTYTVLHVSSIAGENNWVADDGTELMNFTITVANNRITNVVCHPVAPTTSSLSVTNVEFVGDMNAKEDNIVRVTVNNAGDDFFGNLALYYNTTTSPSSSKRYVQLATLKPGETTHDFVVKLPKGEYNLWFYAWATDGYAGSYFDSGRKMFIGYGADANMVQVGNLQFDGQTGTALEVKSVNGVLANELTGSFDITNSSGHTYNNTYYVCVEYGVTKYANVEIHVSVGDGTTTIPFSLGVVSGLASGTTYKVRLYYKDGTTEVNVGDSKNLTLQPYFRYWYADGTVKEAKEPTSWWTEGKVMDPDAKANAVAIDMRGIKKDYMDEVTNDNCLYYMEESQKPTSSSSDFGKTNNVINGVAEKVTINSAESFFVPEAFTATEISFTRSFIGMPSWETIVLPFDVNNVKQGDKNLKWFKSASDKRCHFWVMALTDMTDEVLTFDYATEFKANTPYIIQVPADQWGENWNLAGKTLTFKGLNVNVPATVFDTESNFIGTFAPITVEGLILNSEGNKFLFNEAGTVAAYNAYINAANNANSLRIVIAGDEIATGIGQVTIDNDQDLYDLQGRRVQHAQKGLYIQNGKVVVIK
ncbi:MAG: C10 family peptidase [Prevotella sp.]|nr:C10 family peptidase [Prevotella sp.]